MLKIKKDERQAAIRLLQRAHNCIKENDENFVCLALISNEVIQDDYILAHNIKKQIQAHLKGHYTVDCWLEETFGITIEGRGDEYRLKWIEEMIAQLRDES